VLDLLGQRESTARPSEGASDFYAQIGAGVRERRAAAAERPDRPGDEARR